MDDRKRFLMLIRKATAGRAAGTTGSGVVLDGEEAEVAETGIGATVVDCGMGGHACGVGCARCGC
ncbi:hypothetical protein BU26DRAFT_525931 [Trematosphaeria pertusa]|uniref:Uncharacterized protein n=1 Tax=Trematosphaeria pertusa TaxID=390896 RepID=A0A6A6HR44_9PLEO|nr:uncharacterized protein BU26DRAFT_525931 [Trematosphaeria pertusa]KAF2240467.1 hypothetical protein BU26DRAFT_525931 [Trematosphaeria pertusa]